MSDIATLLAQLEGRKRQDREAAARALGAARAQEAVPVLPGDDEETLHNRIHELEYRIYPQAIRYFCEGRLRVEGRHVYIEEG